MWNVCLCANCSIAGSVGHCPLIRQPLEAVEAGRTDSQQLKAKMPSFVEFDEWCRDNLCATRRDIYDYMARHFGH
jgi:benzoyl-CoA reductase/2-hydroxyglutaryl-CoA dehydratase subunit BcrC/BadD/HgdB